MLTIIHGDDIASSRKFFTSLKDQHHDSVTHQGSTITVTDLSQALSGGSLFAETKYIFIEELFSKKTKGKELEAILNLLQDATNNMVLWEGKTLTPVTLSQFKNAQIRIFKLPQSLFAFLDSIMPGHAREMVALFHKSLETSEAEMIFYMLVRHIRLLLAVYEEKAKIEETARMVPWIEQKLRRQSQTFHANQLLSMHQKLYTLDKGLKTGALQTDLATSIDFLLTEI